MLTCLGDIRFYTDRSGSEDHQISSGRFFNGTIWDHGFLFAKATKEESERGIGILAATTLDVMLEKLIYVSLKDGSDKDLFGPSGLYPSLYSKINYCKFSHLISLIASKNLDLVRKIRNDFAHKIDGRFNEHSIASRVKCLDFAELADLKDTSNLPFRFKAHSISLMLNVSTLIHYKRMSAPKSRQLYDMGGFSILDQHKKIYFEHLKNNPKR